MWTHMLLLLLLLTASAPLTQSAVTTNVPHFTNEQLVNHFEHEPITSASGLAPSRIHKGVLYTHNDRDNPTPYVYAINASTAALISTLRIFPATNVDWEDIAVGPCGSKSCIYIADTGSTRNACVYRVEEPDYIYSDQILQDAEKLTFNWTGVPSNHVTSRALLVDKHGYAYLVNDRNHGIGAITPEMWNNPHHMDIGTHYHPNIPRNHNHTFDPESGDISSDGSQVLILTSDHVYYWHVRHDNVLTSLRSDPQILPRQADHHLGGICWDLGGRNYYTVREMHAAPLFIHRRIDN